MTTEVKTDDQSHPQDLFNKNHPEWTCLNKMSREQVEDSLVNHYAAFPLFAAGGPIPYTRDAIRSAVKLILTILDNPNGEQVHNLLLKSSKDKCKTLLKAIKDLDLSKTGAPQMILFMQPASVFTAFDGLRNKGYFPTYFDVAKIPASVMPFFILSITSGLANYLDCLNKIGSGSGFPSGREIAEVIGLLESKSPTDLDQAAAVKKFVSKWCSKQVKGFDLERVACDVDYFISQLVEFVNYSPKVKVEYLVPTVEYNGKKIYGDIILPAFGEFVYIFLKGPKPAENLYTDINEWGKMLA